MSFGLFKFYAAQRFKPLGQRRPIRNSFGWGIQPAKKQLPDIIKGDAATVNMLKKANSI